MGLTDINMAKRVVAKDELTLAYAVADTIETLKNNSCVVLDISNVFTLQNPEYDATNSVIWKVGRIISFNQPKMSIDKQE